MNNINKTEKITEKMIYNIAKENSLRDFLSNNYIAKIDQIYEIKHYQRNNYRRGLIIDVKEKDADETTKI